MTCKNKKNDVVTNIHSKRIFSENHNFKDNLFLIVIRNYVMVPIKKISSMQFTIRIFF